MMNEENDENDKNNNNDKDIDEDHRILTPPPKKSHPDLCR